MPTATATAIQSLLKVSDVARFLNVHRITVHRLIDRKELPAVWVGDTDCRVCLDDLLSYCDRRRTTSKVGGVA